METFYKVISVFILEIVSYFERVIRGKGGINPTRKSHLGRNPSCGGR